MSTIKIETTLDKELVIYSPSGEFTYRGEPDGCPVQSAIATEDDRVIVLWDRLAKSYGSKDNLLLLDIRGQIIWRAELPESSSDSYTQFEYSNGRLSAFSWSCHRVEIDMKTGKIFHRVFTQ
jgi:hypothetical protein